jgi:hypothetical protein
VILRTWRHGSGGKCALGDFAGIGVSQQSIIRADSKRWEIAIVRAVISSAQVAPAIGDEFLGLWLAARNTYYWDHAPEQNFNDMRISPDQITDD